MKCPSCSTDLSFAELPLFLLAGRLHVKCSVCDLKFAVVPSTDPEAYGVFVSASEAAQPDPMEGTEPWEGEYPGQVLRNDRGVSKSS